MRNIVKTLCILSIIAVIPDAFGATARVNSVNKNATRLPSIAGHLVSGTVTTTGTTTSSTAAYYGDSECIEKYTDCIKEDDACGSDFEECTTNVLFHGQMSKCLSVLYQCSSSGVNALFGTSAINALSTVSTTSTVDGVTEVTRYTYPTDGSVLGQLIIGASITNKLTTEQCVRRYTNCLQRDEICGSDFELCTTNKSFRKQAMLCDSTLQRCQNDGKKELFGSVANAASLSPQGESRLKQLIEEGNALAALNAVKTCQKVTDNCLISACTKNPLRCVEGIKMGPIYAADFVTGGSELAGATSSTQNLLENYNDNYLESLTGSEIRKMLKAQCLETIGANRYCHMTYREKAPSNKDLVDIDLQEDVFSLAYAARKDAVNTKIQEAVKKFDTKAKSSCVDTIKSCAMRSCGGGLGSVCYKQSRIGNANSTSTSKDVSVHVNGANTYNEIKSGCAAIVNADANCIYAATSSEDGGYTYTYYDEDGSTFAKLFPQYGKSTSDPIGAVGTLDALLATSYNDAAIEKMKKQCQNVASSCVKSMCGKEYINCYRNRTDVVAADTSTYSTGAKGGAFDKSMNKVGGVLDYNIVIGLCMNTVKNATVCDEHLKIEAVKLNGGSRSQTWNGSVRNSWWTANTTSVLDTDEDKVITGCYSTDQDKCPGTVAPVSEDSSGNTICDVVEVDEDGNTCIYDQPLTESQTEYALTSSAKSLFQQLLVDIEKEVQQIYNAKLTKEQNICSNNNNGGIKGRSDNGATFMWVKLRSNKVPNDYVSKGLQTKHFTKSNDLYGSFCRARITVQSDDKDIQDLLKNNSVAYFAVGDTFTCGSWISDKMLRQISDTVGERELCKQGYGVWENGKCNGDKMSVKEKIAYSWATVGGALGGGALGLGLTESGLLSKAITKGNEKNSVSQATIDKWSGKCVEAANNATTGITVEDVDDDADVFVNKVTTVNAYANQAHKYCDNMGISVNEGCRDFSISYALDKEGKLKDVDKLKNRISSFKASMAVLESACENYVTTGENGKAIKAARIAVPIVTTLAGGGLGYGITASVIKANKENIKNTAAQQWMDEVGEHIQCYIGTEELGTYGDVVSIELD